MTTTALHEPRPPYGRIVLAAGLLPLALSAAGTALVLAWRADLPDPVATHWGPGGAADGFTSVSGTAVLIGVAGGLLALTGLGFALAVRHAALTRFAAALGSGTTAFVVGMVVALTERQRGIPDAADATISGWAIAGVAAGAVVLGLAAAALIPSWPTSPTTPLIGEAGHPVTIGATERVSWSRPVHSAPVAVAIMIGSTLLTAALALALQAWGMLAVPALLVVLSALLISIRVTVDDRGVTVRGALGWPRTLLPLEQIAAARVVEVRAMRHFGGYGYRLGAIAPYAGVKGWVLRSGEALLVERSDGARDIVVVDDAATAAGLVTALRERVT